MNMDQKKYTCGICGTAYTSLDDYLKCVSSCVVKEKNKNEQKYLEELNAALNRVKQAKKYYDEQMANFKEKYPKEYELNFGDGLKCSCGTKATNKDENKDSAKNCGCKTEAKTEAANKGANKNKTSFSDDALNDLFKSIEVAVIDNGKEKPEIKAKVNGKKVDDKELDKLLEDSDMKYLGKLLGFM